MWREQWNLRVKHQKQGKKPEERSARSGRLWQGMDGIGREAAVFSRLPSLLRGYNWPTHLPVILLE